MKRNLQLLYGLLLAFVLLFSCKKEENNTPPPNNTPVGGTPENVSGFQKGRQGDVFDVSLIDTVFNSGVQYDWDIVTSPEGSNATLNFSNNTATLASDSAGWYELVMTAVSGDQSAEYKYLIAASGVIEEGVYSPKTLDDLFEPDSLVDYFITTDFNWPVQDELTIEDGVIIEVESDIRIWVTRDGVFKANGSAEKGIIIRGESKEAGFWRGLSIETANTQNRLNYVQIYHGGNANGDGANLFLRGNTSTSAHITNSIFSESSDYGLLMTPGTDLLTFGDNTFEDNTSAGLRVDAEQIDMLDATLAFNNNGKDAIEIDGAGNTATISSALSIKPLQAGIWYEFVETMELKDDVEILAGSWLKFQPVTKIWITSDGSLNVQGSAANKVTIEGTLDTPGAWQGIHVVSQTPLNSIDHAIVKNGGSYDYSLGSANIYIDYSSVAVNMTVTNSEISGSTGYGVIVENNAVLSESNNVYSNNTDGNILDDN